ncbi:transporter, major facilitator family protein [delta proteobacterium NaphS2]|nr:transporter, major facilitator family protein [delta proteobacterium NaphS2]
MTANNSTERSQSLEPRVDPDFESAGFTSFLGPVLFLTSIFFLNFTSRIIFAPLLPSIEMELALAHAEAASLFLFIGIGYFVSITGSSLVSSRISHRKTIVLSATAVGISLIWITLCNSLWSIRFGLLMLGLGAGLYLPSGMASLTAMVTSRHWGKAIATHELAPNCGFFLAPLLAEGLMIWFSWRGVLLFLGGCSILTGIMFAFFGKGGDFSGEPLNFLSLKILFKENAFWIMVILFTLGISATMGIYTMLPLFLVAQHGLERNWANTLVAFSRISGIFMAFVSGWATDRVGPRLTMSGVFLMTGAATLLLGALTGSWLVALVFLQPVVAVCFFPPGFAALSAIGPGSARNVAVSMAIPFGFLVGGGAIPMGIGMMGDAGMFALGVSMAGGLILSGAVLALFYKPGT